MSQIFENVLKRKTKKRKTSNQQRGLKETQKESKDTNYHVVLFGDEQIWEKEKISLKQKYHVFCRQVQEEFTTKPILPSPEIQKKAKLQILVNNSITEGKSNKFLELVFDILLKLNENKWSFRDDLYTQKSSSFWSHETGTLKEIIWVANEKFCKSGFCWGSEIVKLLQKEYGKQIEKFYEQGKSPSSIKWMWYGFPHRPTFDHCECALGESWAEVQELEQRFYRRIWLDFLSGNNPQSFRFAAVMMETPTLLIPNRPNSDLDALSTKKTITFQRWSRAQKYPYLPKSHILSWCTRLAFLGVSEANYALSHLAYYGKLSDFFFRDLDCGIKREELLEKCVFEFEATTEHPPSIGAMNLWFLAQYNQFHNEPASLNVKTRFRFFKRLITEENKRDLNVCVLSWITETETKDSKKNKLDLPLFLLKALPYYSSSPQERVALWYQRAKSGDESSLRGFLLCCKDVPEEEVQELFKEAQITKEQKRAWFEELKLICPRLTEYAMKTFVEKEYGYEFYKEWRKVQAFIDPNSNIAFDYVNDLKGTNLNSTNFEILFKLATFHCCPAIDFFAGEKSETWMKFLSEDAINKLEKILEIDFWNRLYKGTLLNNKKLPKYYQNKMGHTSALFVCLDACLAVLRKQKVQFTYVASTDEI